MHAKKGTFPILSASILFLQSDPIDRLRFPTQPRSFIHARVFTRTVSLTIPPSCFSCDRSRAASITAVCPHMPVDTINMHLLLRFKQSFQEASAAGRDSWPLPTPTDQAGVSLGFIAPTSELTEQSRQETWMQASNHHWKPIKSISGNHLRLVKGNMFVVRDKTGWEGIFTSSMVQQLVEVGVKHSSVERPN